MKYITQLTYLLFIIISAGCEERQRYSDQDSDDVKVEERGAGEMEAGEVGAGEVVREAEYSALGDDLSFESVQMLGTHNSYHLRPQEITIPDWSYDHSTFTTQLQMGIRQIEIDLHLNAEGHFDIYHIPRVDQHSSCPTLIECTEELMAWSNLNPRHLPLVILIELKDEFDQIKITDYDHLDQRLLDLWGRERIFTPGDLKGDFESVRRSLELQGWPTLGRLRGHVMFVLLDNSEHRDAYLADDPLLERRVIFARGGEGESFGAILEIGDPRGDQELIQRARMGHYLIRASADQANQMTEEREEQRRAALISGAHWLNTDFSNPVDGGEWREGLELLPRCLPDICDPNKKSQ